MSWGPGEHETPFLLTSVCGGSPMGPPALYSLPAAGPRTGVLEPLGTPVLTEDLPSVGKTGGALPSSGGPGWVNEEGSARYGACWMLGPGQGSECRGRGSARWALGGRDKEKGVLEGIGGFKTCTKPGWPPGLWLGGGVQS